MNHRLALVAATLLPLLSACAADPGTARPSPDSAGTTSPDAATSTSPPPEPSTPPERAATRIRFAFGDAEIIVRVAENPTSRDLVSALPLTLEFEDFAGRETVDLLP